MKAKELAEALLRNPDFEVKFCFSEINDSSYGMSVRSFENVEIADIGWSDKIIVLSGDEQ